MPYNNDFHFDTISAKDIAERIKTTLGKYYPSGDEKALVDSAIDFFETKDGVDKLAAHEPNFDGVEKLVVEIADKIHNYNLINNGPETTISVNTITIEGDVYESYATTYEPLITAYVEYQTLWGLRDNQELPELNGTFKDPWKDIDTFEPKAINYTEEQADAKVDYVRNGLQSDPSATRNTFVNDSLKLEKHNKKLQYQVNMYPSWKGNLESNKKDYLKILFQEALVVDCNAKIERLKKPKF